MFYLLIIFYLYNIFECLFFMNYEFSFLFGRIEIIPAARKNNIGWKLSNNHYGMSIGIIIGLVLEGNQ